MTGVQRAFADLREKIDGTVSMPGDAGYATAVSIWNGVIQWRPAVVVSCSSTDDGVAALGSFALMVTLWSWSSTKRLSFANAGRWV